MSFEPVNFYDDFRKKQISIENYRGLAYNGSILNFGDLL
jgi:hypothetical protein